MTVFGLVQVFEDGRKLSNMDAGSREAALYLQKDFTADEFLRNIKPGLTFILEEETYIRVEDTVLVTQDGVETLTGSCPREIDDVEATLGGAGLLQHCPPVHFNTSR